MKLRGEYKTAKQAQEASTGKHPVSHNKNSLDDDEQGYHDYLLRVKFGGRRDVSSDVEAQKCRKRPKTEYRRPLQEIDKELYEQTLDENDTIHRRQTHFLVECTDTLTDP